MTASVAGTPAIGARAVTPSWNGKYSLVRYAAGKSGSSVAARQAEPTFSADYVFTTACSSGTCVATATDGPAPKNPTLPQPSHYTWDGAKWVERFDFQWDCYRGEGVPKVWAPARSWAFYTHRRRTDRCAVAGTPTSTAARAAAPSKCRWRRLPPGRPDKGAVDQSGGAPVMDAM